MRRGARLLMSYASPNSGHLHSPVPMTAPLSTPTLPPGIRSRFVRRHQRPQDARAGGGLRDKPAGPCLLLLHGFPELAYSWRKVMLPLAAAGYHVVAPDQRGYGRTTGWDADYDGDLGAVPHAQPGARCARRWCRRSAIAPSRPSIGHDFGSPVAAWCALLRPDVFRSVVLMSAPFAGPPALPFDTARSGADARTGRPRHPRRRSPRCRRRASTISGTTRRARPTTTCGNAPQGMHAFLRAYYHHKSADWTANKPYPLTAWTAEELAKLPTYYVMDLDKGMAETVAAEMPSRSRDRRLPLADRRRACASTAASTRAPASRAGCNGTAAGPAAGSTPSCRSSPAAPSTCRRCSSPARATGASTSARRLRADADARLHADAAACHLVDGAGHWVQQEQPEAVTRLLLSFLKGAA